MPTQKDNVTISFHFKVTAEQATAVEKGLADHADWMRTVHSIGPGKEVELVDYYVSKAQINKTNQSDVGNGFDLKKPLILSMLCHPKWHTFYGKPCTQSKLF